MIADEELSKLKDEIEKEDALSDAIYQFNIKPKVGVYVLCNVFDVDPNPNNIARLLHGVDGLSDITIGEWLSKSENEEILDAYFNQLDLKCGFLTALRRCMADSLHLPAESDGIDRVLESIARVFCIQNPNVFNTPDNAYILAFSIMLLNSDLHNRNHSKKMNEKDFISNCRNAIPEDSINDNTLKRIYNEIKSKPFAFRTKPSGDFLANSAPSFKGMLKKRGDSWRSFWTEHFFVLANSCLYYFESDSPIFKDSPIGMIQLVGVEVTSVPGTQRCISIEDKRKDLDYVKYKKRGPKKVPGIRRIYLQAPTDKLFKHWLYRLQTCVISSNVDNDDRLMKSDTAVDLPKRSTSVFFAEGDIVETHSHKGMKPPEHRPSPKIKPKAASDDDDIDGITETIPQFVLNNDPSKRVVSSPKPQRRMSIEVDNKITGDGEEVLLAPRTLSPTNSPRTTSTSSLVGNSILFPVSSDDEKNDDNCQKDDEKDDNSLEESFKFEDSKEDRGEPSQPISLREFERVNYSHGDLKHTQLEFCETELVSSQELLKPTSILIPPPQHLGDANAPIIKNMSTDDLAAFIRQKRKQREGLD